MKKSQKVKILKTLYFTYKNEKIKIIVNHPKNLKILCFLIYAEVVTFVAGSLEAGGLPGSLEIPEVLK